jgi:hypothetical protein
VAVSFTLSPPELDGRNAENQQNASKLNPDLQEALLWAPAGVEDCPLHPKRKTFAESVF